MTDPTPPAAPRPCECGHIYESHFWKDHGERIVDACHRVDCGCAGYRPVSPETALRCSCIAIAGHHAVGCALAAPPTWDDIETAKRRAAWEAEDKAAEAAPPRATTAEPMTEERLAEIRSGLDRYPMPAAKELLAEVDRLRASSPSRESGALAQAWKQKAKMYRRQADYYYEKHSASQHAADAAVAAERAQRRLLDAKDEQIATLERDAARMREAAITRAYDALPEGCTMIATAKLEALREAATALLAAYVRIAGSGDCGYWNPEEEPEVIALRAALTPSVEPTTTPETSDG